MTKHNAKLILEYIWLDSEGNSRGKTKVMNNINNYTIGELTRTPSLLPKWNYDGSSTKQAITESSEVILNPVKVTLDPFRQHNLCNNDSLFLHCLVLCDTYKSSTVPLDSNTRYHAVKIFDIDSIHKEPMFGLEQEFFISKRQCYGEPPVPIAFAPSLPEPQGDYYCGVGGTNVYRRELVEEMLDKLNYAGLPITGLNAEVAPSQWEFQVCSIGIDAADSLILLRYICNRVLEKHNMCMDLAAKPVKGDWNGSGCHINYSTSLMRETNGIYHINKAISKLSDKHHLHIKHYGDDNRERLTGNHETSSVDNFTSSVAGRNTSIRIPTDTHHNKCGYFEDRRPSSSLDPYKATALLHATSVGITQTYWE